MNLKEFDEFRLEDAVHFHNKLNPAIFVGDKMRDNVRVQLLNIAEDFIDHLGIKDLEIKDITISGSSAAYSYTSHSDIDLHILVDYNEFKDDDVYRELFDAKKTVYNAQHEITISGYDVELYIQDSNQPVISLGEYSVLRDSWIRLPRKRRANFDQLATKLKYQKLVQLARYAIKTNNESKIKNVLKTIKKYRQAGLDANGEFGPENLAFKALRTNKVIDRLYEKLQELHDHELSLPESVSESKLLDKPELSIAQLSKKHGVSKEHLQKQLSMGIKVEMEHTSKYDVAKEIALDHLIEDPNYYTKLDKINLEESREIPQEIYNLLDELTADDTGSEDFGDYVLRFEGFTDWCQQDAAERCDLPDNDPRKLKYYEDVYDEVLQGWIKEQGSQPVDKGFAGSEDYPVQWAVFKKQDVTEAFDAPYSMSWEHNDGESHDALVKLPDGSPLSIMFSANRGWSGDELWTVEFWRNNSQDVTGEGDAQRIFATVLSAIQQFIDFEKPEHIQFSASKETDAGDKNASRSSLYTNLVKRYARSWGYDVDVSDHAGSVGYDLHRMSKSLTEAGLQFHDDVPNEEWLQHAIDYVKKQPKDGFGKPSMIEVTGTFNRPVVASISRLVKIPGARGEQSNVRENDLQAIMKIMRETGKLPLGRDGKEYIPLIGVDYTGQPWVLEGNHRIMAAWNLYTKENINKWDRMPVEIRYFDGGERVKDGPIYPGKMAALKEQYVTEDTLNEYRNALYDFVKSKFPTWPEYVLKDFLYAQAKGIRNEEELKDWLERNQKDFGQVKWRLEKLPITLDIFTPKTQRMIKQREGGSSNPYQVPRDAERHAQQLKMIQQQGVRTEPIIVAKLDNGYDLIEGWHRTIQHLQQYPEGYTGPAWVAYGATYTSEGVTEGSLEEVSQDTARSYAQKARASQKDLINQTHRKGADTDKLNKKIQNRQQGLNRAHTDKRYYKDDQGVAEDLAQGRNLNPETKKYVQDHKWKLTTVNPMDLDTDAFDDPYNRVIDIDVDHPVNFKDPIIVDANGVIIDGFHRAYQAQQQGLEKLPAYVPVKEVTEKVNPAILKHGYTKEKNYGDIRLVAQQQDLEEVFPSFVITAYDGDKKIAAVRFSVRDLRRYGFDKAKDAFLVSANTKVDPEYRKRGIAKAMYDFARELGNDIQPSEVQTDDGRKMWARWKEFERTVTESGSGYIPSKKEKNDPRFKTALSVDVKPDTLKKNAKAFGFKVSRAGIPPTLR